MSTQRMNFLFGRWIVPQECFAKAQRTQRKAGAGPRTAFLKLHDLHTTAAKVENHSINDRQRTNSTKAAVVGLFVRVNDLDIQAELVSGSRDQVFSVLSIPHGRSRHSNNMPGSTGANHGAELSEGAQTRGNR